MKNAILTLYFVVSISASCGEPFITTAGQEAGSVVSNLFAVLLEPYQHEQDNVAFVRETVERNTAQFKRSVNQSLPENQEEAAALIKVRESKLQFLKTGIRWSLIEEMTDGCGIIVLNRDCDGLAIDQRLPSEAELNLYQQRGANEQTKLYGSIVIYDPSRQYGYRTAEYFPGPRSVMTAVTGVPQAAANLGNVYNIEPELTFLILLSCKMVGPAYATKSTNSCHPSLYDYSRFRLDPEAMHAALANKVVSVVPTPIDGQSSIVFDLGSELVLKILFSPQGRIRIPKIELVKSGVLTRLITRRVVNDHPWFLEWRDERYEPGMASDVTERFFLKSEAMAFQETLARFNERYVTKSAYKSVMTEAGRSVTTKDTALGRQVIGESSDPQERDGMTSRHWKPFIISCFVIMTASIPFILRARSRM